jgi:hypothetical protein
MGILQINALHSAVIEDSLAHASPLPGTFDFLKVDGHWEKVSRLDGHLPFTAVSGAPHVDTTKTITLYRSEDSIFVEVGAGADFIDG